MIQFDDTEFQDGFTARSLLMIESLHGKDIANILDSPVVKIDVDSNRRALRSDILHTA
jgi:hypothetical protein